MEDLLPDNYDSGLLLDNPQRRYPRYRLPLPVRVREENGPTSQTALLQDISLNGFYFTSQTPYETNALLKVHLVLGTREYKINARVQRSDPTLTSREPLYGTAVLFVRGGEIHEFIQALAAHFTRLPHAWVPDESVEAGVCA